MKRLADILLQIAVRELKTARCGQEKARDLVDEVHGLRTSERDNDTAQTGVRATET